MDPDATDKLTLKQRKFIEVYDGNGTEAARVAGYTGDDNTLGVTAHELLRNPKISQAVNERVSKSLTKLIATREDRQKFWTDTMHSSDLEMAYRLKASELLGRSQADFTLNIEHSGSIKLDTVSDDELNERIEKLLGEKK